MNCYVTGGAIKALREKQHLTQSQLAMKLGVSDKAVSKWETGRCNYFDYQPYFKRAV